MLFRRPSDTCIGEAVFDHLVGAIDVTQVDDHRLRHFLF